MELSAEDAAKFWPIYSRYDADLTKLNEQRVANIEEYARTYNQMTDEKGGRVDSEVLRVPKRTGRASRQNI